MLREFAVEACGWKLVEHNMLVPFVQEMGHIAVRDGKWAFGVSLAAPVVLIYTSLPHPDDARQKSIFALDMRDGLRALAQRLVDGSQPPAISEAQARAICEALGEWPNYECRFYRLPSEPDQWPDIPSETPDHGEADRGQVRQRVPLWRVVQRAAAVKAEG
jgi:hypothetical protein